MQTAAETYGRAVDTIFVFDESKAKHDVNEVEESCACSSQVTIVVLKIFRTGVDPGIDDH
jgi:hypothetical protein